MNEQIKASCTILEKEDAYAFDQQRSFETIMSFASWFIHRKHLKRDLLFSVSQPTSKPGQHNTMDFSCFSYWLDSFCLTRAKFWWTDSTSQFLNIYPSSCMRNLTLRPNHMHTSLTSVSHNTSYIFDRPHYDYAKMSKTYFSIN